MLIILYFKGYNVTGASQKYWCIFLIDSFHSFIAAKSHKLLEILNCIELQLSSIYLRAHTSPQRRTIYITEIRTIEVHCRWFLVRIQVIGIHIQMNKFTSRSSFNRALTKILLRYMEFYCSVFVLWNIKTSLW